MAGAPERPRVSRSISSAQATVFLDNLSQYAAQLAAPLQQIAVASLGAIGNLLLVVVLSLYMVADRERLVAFLFWLVPTGYKAEAQILEEAVAGPSAGSSAARSITGLVFAAICLVASLVFGLDYIAGHDRRRPASSWRSRSSGRSSPGCRRCSSRSCSSPTSIARASRSSSRSAGSSS